MGAEHPVPGRCPSCGESMYAPTVVCRSCSVEVQGEFGPCPFCRLEGEDRRIFELFLASRGNLKEVERALGISYPTVRQKVDEVLTRLGYPRGSRPDRMTVLRRLRAGDLTPEEATRLLRN